MPPGLFFLIIFWNILVMLKLSKKICRGVDLFWAYMVDKRAWEFSERAP
jgi:hypothetical protein